MPTGDWPPGGGPKVFISYAHDTDDHRAQVLALGELLVRLNIRVALDHWAEYQRQDWVAWATDLITTADFVLVVASPRYRVTGAGTPGVAEGRGVQAESAVLRELLLDDRTTWLPKILPVVLPGRSIAELPTFLQPRSASHFVVPAITVAGVKPLLRVLTGQPAYLRPEPGSTPYLPPRSDGRERDPGSGWVPWRAEVDLGDADLPVLELHLLHVGAKPLQMRRLAELPQTLAAAGRAHGLFGTDTEVRVSWSDRVAAAVRAESERLFSGVAVSRDGGRCAWQTPALVNLDQRWLTMDLSRMMKLLTGLPLPEPERVTVAASLEPGFWFPLLKIGSLAIRPSPEAPPVTAEENLRWAELRRAPHEYADELAARLVGARRRRRGADAGA